MVKTMEMQAVDERTLDSVLPACRRRLVSSGAYIYTLIQRRLSSPATQLVVHAARPAAAAAAAAAECRSKRR